jgi:hypothetical protein
MIAPERHCVRAEGATQWHRSAVSAASVALCASRKAGPPASQFSGPDRLVILLAFLSTLVAAQRPSKLLADELSTSRPVRSTRRSVPPHTPFSADFESRGGAQTATISPVGEVTLELEGALRRFSLAGIAADTPANAFASGDIDGDGLREILALFDHAPRLRAFDPSGGSLFSVDLPPSVEFSVLDDGDGADDLLLPIGDGGARRFALRPSPRVVYPILGRKRITRFTTGDWDRDGDVEIAAVDESGAARVFSAAGKTLFTGSFGVATGNLALVGFDPDPGTFDLVATGGGRLMSLADDAKLRFSTPVDGALSNLQTQDLDGLPPAELVAVVTIDDAASVRAWRHDGTEIFRGDVGGRIRSYAVATLGRPGRRYALAATERSSCVAVFDLQGGPERALELGSYVRSLSTADFEGDEGQEMLVLGADGVLRVFDAGLALRRELRATAGRMTSFRATDLDADRKVEIVAGVDDGSVVEVLGADGRSRGVAGAGSLFAGAQTQLADLDGEGSREIVFVKETGGPQFPHTHVTALRLDGTRLFERTLPGGKSRTAFADVDADRGADIIICTDVEGLVALGQDGRARWRVSFESPAEVLRTVDLDRDGVAEVMVLHVDGVLRQWTPNPRDDRPRRCALFLSALASAEKGDEPAAAAAFTSAGVDWISLDDFGVEALRRRLSRVALDSPAAATTLGQFR